MFPKWLLSMFHPKLFMLGKTLRLAVRPRRITSLVGHDGSLNGKINPVYSLKVAKIQIMPLFKTWSLLHAWNPNRWIHLFTFFSEEIVNASSHIGYQFFRLNINNLDLNATADLNSVSCFAQVWNTSEWKNKTVYVNVKGLFLSFHSH